MTRRSGLGKGLELAHPDGRRRRPGGGGDADHPVLVEISVADVTPNPHQPRVHFDEETLGELAASIAQLGVLQPVLVRRVGDKYQLIAGERRWRAARRAGLATVPAVIRTTDDVRAVEQALVENLHREDLTPLEEAAAYQQLIEDFGLTHDDVAAAGRQEPLGGHQHVATARPAAGGPAPARRRQAVGRARPGAARHAGPRPAGAPGPPGGERGLVGAHGRGVGAQRGPAAAAATATPAPKPEAEPVDGAGLVDATRLRPPGLLELEQLLADALDTRVGVQMGAKRGRVTIDFADLEDLERIYRLIVGER